MTMSIRSLDLLDLPIISRYRNDVLTLDSARALTRGHPLGAMGLLTYINPTRLSMDICSAKSPCKASTPIFIISFWPSAFNSEPTDH